MRPIYGGEDSLPAAGPDRMTTHHDLAADAVNEAAAELARSHPEAMKGFRALVVRFRHLLQV